MPETPTTEGSIVAYLRLDSSDWDAKLDAAEQKARDLGRIDPNIRVTADTADAIAKLDAVRLAAERVGGDHVTTVTTVNESVNNASGAGQAAQAAATDTVTQASKRLEAAQNALTRAQAAQEAAERAAANAASTQYLAELRLADVQDKRGRTEYQLAAAEEAVARATRNAEAAEQKQIAAEAAATAAAEKHAAMLAAVAAASDAAADGTDKQGKAAKDAAGGNAANLGYMGTILMVVGALVPVMSQLAGFAAGVGGAFLGMGAAGVLGVLGIKNAMADGTSMGVVYSGAVAAVKSNLDQLEQTAATGILGPFQQIVADMTAAMPQLNTEVGGFSTELGTIGSTVMGTLVQGFAILNPLFREGASYLQGLADSWQAWVNNGGLQKFAQDAEQALPLVGNTLGELVKLVMNLIAAFAPLGTVALTVIDALATGLNMIPAHNLVEIASGATAAFIAFKMWGTLAPILEGVATAVGAVGVAADIAEGPVGWIIGLVGLAAGAVAGLATSTSDNTAATTAYTTALEESNGALDDNVRKTVAKQLADANVLETAKQYHLQLSTVTDAVLGNTDAQKTVNDAIQKYGTHLVEVHGYQGQVTNSYTTLTDKARSLSDAVNGNNKSLKDSVQAYQDQAAAASQATTASENLSGMQKQLAAAQSAVTSDANKLATALTNLGQVNRSADQANIAYQQSLDQANQSLKQNGSTLDETTAKGRANATALDGIANSGLALIAAQAKQGASEQTLQANMGTTRDSFIAVAEQMGLNQTDAENLATQYGLVPSEVATQFTQSGIGDAINQVNQLQNAIGVLLSDEKAVNLGGSVQGYYGFGAQQLPGHAAGGQVTGPGNAMSDTAGRYYPVSDGEWIVSNIQGQSSKWSPMLDLINRNATADKVLGTGMRLAGVHPAGAPEQIVQHTHYWTINTNNAEQLYQDFTRKINAKVGP